MKGTKDELKAAQWFVSLTLEQKRAVMHWCEQNPPPSRWTGSRRAWAYTEMPFKFGMWKIWKDPS